MFKETTESSSVRGEDYLASSDTGKNLKNKTGNRADKASIGAFLKQMPDVVCLSHLRWDFVYQRPQHLLSRFAQHGRLFYVEEPIYDNISTPFMKVSKRGENLSLAVPHLPHGLQEEQVEAIQRELLDELFAEHKLENPILWYYTPMALSFSDHLQPALTVYDCMDELAAFKFAPPRLKDLEQDLFRKADLVFTGGQSLYEAKKKQHPAVTAFPSSIDKAHFGLAKEGLDVPQDQAAIPEPRMGFFGVIDERLDIELLAEVAAAKPDWHFVMVGPVVKVDPASLPQRDNIHYLGGKDYLQLPAYLSSWDVALLPFAINESTAFISPTKTPEYLAAGKPVVSTPVRDVVRPYGEEGLVHIASTAPEFVEAIEAALEQRQDENWKKQVDQFMRDMSWDNTWRGMVELMAQAYQKK